MSTSTITVTEPNAVLSSTVCSLGYIPTGRVVFLFINNNRLVLTAAVDQRGLLEQRDQTVAHMHSAERGAGAPVGIIICWETSDSVPSDMNNEFLPAAVIVVRGDHWHYASNGVHQSGTVDLADATAMKFAVEHGVNIGSGTREAIERRLTPGITNLPPVKSSVNPITLLNAARTNPAHLLNGLTNRKNKSRPVRDVLIGLMVAEDQDRFWLDQCAATLNAAHDDQIADVAAVTALMAYLCGDGVKANICLDLAQAASPQHILSGLLRQALAGAMPPTELRPVFTSSLTARQAAHKAAS